MCNNLSWQPEDANTLDLKALCFQPSPPVVAGLQDGPQ